MRARRLRVRTKANTHHEADDAHVAEHEREESPKIILAFFRPSFPVVSPSHRYFSLHRLRNGTFFSFPSPLSPISLIKRLDFSLVCASLLSPRNYLQEKKFKLVLGAVDDDFKERAIFPLVFPRNWKLSLGASIIGLIYLIWTAAPRKN